MFSTVRPYQWVVIRLPSDTLKVEQMIPNTTISLGKFGSFRTNQVINRPFYLTWEILDKSDEQPDRQLRVVKAAELHADTLLEEAESDLVGDAAPNPEFDEYGLIGSEKSNVNIYDDPANQKLTMEEIEALKDDVASNPRELIAKIMASHSTLDQKTAFSLAKYTLRKRKKYMKRFTLLPLDVDSMIDWFMNEKDFGKVLELRSEMIGLIGCWANVHAAGEDHLPSDQPSECRYLVVDDTGGLVVAALAERMGILHHNSSALESQSSETDAQDAEYDSSIPASMDSAQNYPRKRNHNQQIPTSNTIHLIHSNQQPNLSLLRYFNFDPNFPPSPTDSARPHPLHAHLKPVSWLQLVDPEADSTYQEITEKSVEELQAFKSNARSTYHRKRRRWQRCKSIVDETRAGRFNALIVASYSKPLSILRHLVPLLGGGAQIVVYHPHPEPLTEVVDAYSTARRSAFLNIPESEREEALRTTAFPVDPTLTLGFTMQTTRVRKWQVLPGRTHPLMTGLGGAEGYMISATRVLPLKGKIQARGVQGKRGKLRKPDEDVGQFDAEAAPVIVRDDEVEEEEGHNQKSRLEAGDQDVDMLEQGATT